MRFPWTKKPEIVVPPATAAAPPGNLASAFVILATRQLPRTCDVVAAIKRRVPEFTTTDEASEAPPTAIIGFDVRGASMVPIMFFDVPNPLSQKDTCVATAWWWPDDWQHLQKRQGHVIVNVPHDDPKQRSILLAQITAAVVETTDAIGVIWNPADAVWPAKTFLDAVGESQHGQVPYQIAIATRVGSDTEKLRADGTPTTFGITHGLAEFGLMEVEIRGFPGSVPELWSQLLSIASYLVENGPMINDGDTIGPTEKPAMKIHHRPSTVVPGTRVYSVTLYG